MGVGDAYASGKEVTRTGALSTTQRASVLDPGKTGVISIPQEGELSHKDGLGDLPRSHRKLVGKLETQTRPLKFHSSGSQAPKTSRQTDCRRRGSPQTEVFLTAKVVETLGCDTKKY